MFYELHRFIRVPGENSRREFRPMRKSSGEVYRFSTEQEAIDAIKLWDDGRAIRSDFKVVKVEESNG